MKSVVFSFLAVCALIVSSVIAAPSLAQSAQPQKISRFSGKPLPRFESLRYSAVHGRKGPTLDHPIVWRYERKGLPMLIVRETNGWRRVRDMDGDEVWVQARMLSATRTVMIIKATTLYKSASISSAPIAKATSGLVATLDACEGTWCRVKVQRKTGWVSRAALWGVVEETGSV